MLQKDGAVAHTAADGVSGSDSTRRVDCLFLTTWHRTHHPWNTQDPASTSPAVQAIQGTQWWNQGGEELQQVQQCLESVGIPHRTRVARSAAHNLPKWKGITVCVVDPRNARINLVDKASGICIPLLRSFVRRASQIESAGECRTPRCLP